MNDKFLWSMNSKLQAFNKFTSLNKVKKKESRYLIYYKFFKNENQPKKFNPFQKKKRESMQIFLEKHRRTILATDYSKSIESKLYPPG